MDAGACGRSEREHLSRLYAGCRGRACGASRNASTAISSAALRAMQWACAGCRGFIGQAQAGEALKIGRLEVEMRQRGHVEGQVAGDALGIGERVEDGQAHVGDGDLRQDRAVDVFDERVDGGLRMHGDADLRMAAGRRGGRLR